MDFFKNPKYKLIRVVLLLVIIIGAGWFIMSNMNLSKSNQGSVINQTPTQTGSITVIKNTNPASSTQFTFTTTQKYVPTNQAFQTLFYLVNGGSKKMLNLNLGTYQVLEKPNANYATKYRCVNNGGGGQVVADGGGSFTDITLSLTNLDVVCTFTNTKL